MAGFLFRLDHYYIRMFPETLAGLLKRVYPDFDMSLFSNRLKLQKFIYLLQSRGLDLGYDFSLYHMGPYCTELTKDAFQITDYQKSPPLRFNDVSAEKKFTAFIEFVGAYKDKEDWLEMASTILIFRKLYPKSPKEAIIKLASEKNERFKAVSSGRLESIWTELEKGGFI
jgi:uncharacterized protein YwgA